MRAIIRLYFTLFAVIMLLSSAYAMEEETDTIKRTLTIIHGFARGTLKVDENEIVSCVDRYLHFKGSLVAEKESIHTFIQKIAIPDIEAIATSNIKAYLDNIVEGLMRLKYSENFSISHEMQYIIDDIIPRLVNLSTNNDLTIERLNTFMQMPKEEKLKRDTLDSCTAACLDTISFIKRRPAYDIWEDAVEKIKANRINYVAAWRTGDPKIIKRAITASASNPINLEQMFIYQISAYSKTHHQK